MSHGSPSAHGHRYPSRLSLKMETSSRLSCLRTHHARRAGRFTLWFSVQMKKGPCVKYPPSPRQRFCCCAVASAGLGLRGDTHRRCRNYGSAWWPSFEARRSAARTFRMTAAPGTTARPGVTALVSSSQLDRGDDRHVVRGPPPGPRLLRDCHRRHPVAELRLDPDVIEAAALVGGGPIGRAIAPPGEELGGFGDEAAHHVDPAPRGPDRVEFCALDRRVGDDVE